VKVARKHIVHAIESAGKLMYFKKYIIKAYPYTGNDKTIGEFGWQISVVPNKK
jgi:hypothetical protein